MDLFIELRKKIFKIHNREILDQYFCDMYDDYLNDRLYKCIDQWKIKIEEAYIKYGKTNDENFPFNVYKIEE